MNNQQTSDTASTLNLLFFRLSLLRTCREAEIASVEGLNDLENFILELVSSWKGITMTKISKLLGKPPATICGLINKLESMGFIQRMEKDWLSKPLQLTDAGEQTLTHAHLKFSHGIIQWMDSALKTEEVTKVAEALEILNRNEWLQFQKFQEPPAPPLFW